MFPVERARLPRPRAARVVQERHERRLLRRGHEVFDDEVTGKAPPGPERTRGSVFVTFGVARTSVVVRVVVRAATHQRGPRVGRVRRDSARARACVVAVVVPRVGSRVAPRGRGGRAFPTVQVVVHQAHRHVRAARRAARERRAGRGAHRREMWWPRHASARGQEPVQSDLRPVRAATTGRARVSLWHRAEGPADRDTRAVKCVGRRGLDSHHVSSSFATRPNVGTRRFDIAVTPPVEIFWI